jgi:hypothetical protein
MENLENLKGKKRFGWWGRKSCGKDAKGYCFPFPLPYILSFSTERSSFPLLHSDFFPTNLNPTIFSLFPGTFPLSIPLFPT